jgi:hypothetical protein
VRHWQARAASLRYIIFRGFLSTSGVWTLTVFRTSNLDTHVRACYSTVANQYAGRKTKNQVLEQGVKPLTFSAGKQISIDTHQLRRFLVIIGVLFKDRLLGYRCSLSPCVDPSRNRKSFILILNQKSLEMLGRWEVDYQITTTTSSTFSLFMFGPVLAPVPVHVS